LVEAGLQVTMVEAGGHHSAETGAHLKNLASYHHNPDAFTEVIKRSLPRASDPLANLDQDAAVNLGAARVAHAVGGMGIFWAGATPRIHPVVEAIPPIGQEELARLYDRAEVLLHTSATEYDMSVQRWIILNRLADVYADLPDGYGVQSLPLAAERLSIDPPSVHWSGPELILKGGRRTGTSAAVTLLPETLCTRLIHRGGEVVGAAVRDLATGARTTLVADYYVVAGGSILTPQLLWASGIRPEALGRYLCEQTMATCQIVLSDDLAQQIPDGYDDPEPYLWIPVSENRPWHAQLHRGIFGYDAVPPDVDRRLVTDLVWFSTCDVRESNAVTFSERVTDPYGMPQPTFHFRPSAADRARADDMVTDMARAASALGKFLPGAEPKFLEAGFALHITGTTRMGDDERGSVVDPWARVWGYDNLYLGGGGVIPTGVACNTTLTSVALAIRSAKALAAA
jgi:choline dehydrogenase-like flavoprotein